jgi:hypothetical protein
MSEMGLVKSCDCKRTAASGPRVVFEPIKQADGGYRLRYSRPRLACDRCNEPLVRAPASAPGGPQIGSDEK